MSVSGGAVAVASVASVLRGSWGSRAVRALRGSQGFTGLMGRTESARIPSLRHCSLHFECLRMRPIPEKNVNNQKEGIPNGIPSVFELCSTTICYRLKPWRSVVVHGNELEQVLVAFLRLFLVGFEQYLCALWELACESAVAGLVHEEVLVSAGWSL